MRGEKSDLNQLGSNLLFSLEKKSLFKLTKNLFHFFNGFLLGVFHFNTENPSLILLSLEAFRKKHFSYLFVETSKKERKIQV